LIEFGVCLCKRERGYLDEDLYALFVFALIDMILSDIKCRKKVFDQMVETPVLLPLIFDDEVVCLSFFEQRYGDGIVFVEMLLYKEGCERLIDTLKFGVKGTVVKLYLLDNTWAFDIVVVGIER